MSKVYDTTKVGRLHDLTGIGWEVLIDSEGREIALFLDGNLLRPYPKLSGLDVDRSTVAIAA